MGLRNPERGFRTEVYFSNIPGEIAGTCSVHARMLALDGLSEKIFSDIEVPGAPLLFSHRPDAADFSHSQWQDELDFFAYDGITVMQGYCILMRYAEQNELPQEKLADIEAFFLKLRERRVKTLLRFAYEWSLTPASPSPDKILKHLAQLLPLLQKYQDVVYALECGFIGRWGEWHHNLFMLERDLGFQRELFAALLEGIPLNRRIMVRYPGIKRRLFGIEPLNESEAFTNTARARIGHFNDGFMARSDHGGTFGPDNNQCSPEEARSYLAQEGGFLPVDGELYWKDHAGPALPADSLNHLAEFHFDTLSCVHSNSDFEGERHSIDLWKRVPVDPWGLASMHIPVSDAYFTDAAGRFVRRSHYEYIRDHLGYRLELLSADLPDYIAPGEKFRVKIRLVNRGFSAPVNPRPVRLTIEHRQIRHVFAFNTDIRRWYSGAEQLLEVEAELPKETVPGRVEFGLWMPDGCPSLENLPECAIRCANFIESGNGVNILGQSEVV